MLPTVETKPVVLKLSLAFDEVLTETEITDMCSDMIHTVSAEAGIAGIDVTDVVCEMTAYNVVTFDYNVVLTLAIPEANGDVSMEVAGDLVASIDELGGASVTLTSVTDGEKDTVYTTLSRSTGKAALHLFAPLCALVVVMY
jgi:hypothetical protein